MTSHRISIIIPTLDEESGIASLLEHLRTADTAMLVSEIIVVDGGSGDRTVTLAAACGARVVQTHRRGRGLQMNAGARSAQGSILYFLHADTLPPTGFSAMIVDAVDAGCSSGCFRLRFDNTHWFLRASGWFTRFDIDLLRFGDQSLFATRDAFFGCGGFDPARLLMEDQEIVGRLRGVGRFRVLSGSVVTSARRYLDNGIYRLQGIFAAICLGSYFGIAERTLVDFYRRRIIETRPAATTPIGTNPGLETTTITTG